MGFRVFALTPLTGDVFMDKDLKSKLRYLEENDGVDGIVFYTNFIGANQGLVDYITSLTKIAKMEISIYGHDLRSFCAVSGKGAAQYRRLVGNLSHLADAVPGTQLGEALTISMSTYGSFSFPGKGDSDLCRVLETFVDKTGTEISMRRDYDSWGGLISKGDVRELDINLIDGRHLYKSGPCRLVFGYVQIVADGRVNACACRDVGGSLMIGDLEAQPLREILSNRNPAYMRVIEEQEAGRFQESCQQCTFYQSIYDARPGAEPFGRGIVSRHEFDEILDGGGE
jgi:radical SAM protein with 4Fe4S-binding SPASM domain